MYVTDRAIKTLFLALLLLPITSKAKSLFHDIAFIVAKIEDSKITKKSTTGLRSLEHTSILATFEDKAHIGSNSKAMTAYLVALAINENKLDWTTKIRDFFPEIKIDPSNAELEINHLLAHRSGLVSVFSYKDVWAKLWNESLPIPEGRKLITQTVLKAKAKFGHNSKFEYNNDNYRLLGMILEKIYKMSWEEVLTQKLFRPLQMTSCGFGAPGSSNLKRPIALWGHRLSHGKLTPVAPTIAGDNPPSSRISGGVHCNLNDWGKFLQLAMDTYNGKNKLLRKDIAKKLFEPAASDSEYTFGGWNLVERDWGKGVVFTHSGSNTLNYSVAWLAPKINTAFYGVSNSGEDEVYNELDKKIAELIY